jgi:hypothetical protein
MLASHNESARRRQRRWESFSCSSLPEVVGAKSAATSERQIVNEGYGDISAVSGSTRHQRYRASNNTIKKEVTYGSSRREQYLLLAGKEPLKVGEGRGEG